MAGPGLGPWDLRGDPAGQEKAKGGRREGEPGRNQLHGPFPREAVRVVSYQVCLGPKGFMGDKTSRVKASVWVTLRAALARGLSEPHPHCPPSTTLLPPYFFLSHLYSFNE